ncbi:two-component sensor histidine kinase [Actinomadura rubrobrunea]|uniref:histidine kinase n=1 Tax=Actinomadura rubrobrunea TaxID=115335 RepID=A0A9W6PUA7_9ACTN|nr:histidine kinase [Actinomadura rubrobrunea]GLW63900.1 two-component sensor histidine kinase [Actinomadura rubrobrunea]
MRLHRPPRGLLLDAAIAAATLALVLGAAVTQDGPGPAAGQIAAAVAACGALALRRRHPVAVLVLTLVLTAVSGALGESGGPVFVAYIVALYTAAAEGRLPVAVVLAVVGFMGMLLHGAVDERGSVQGQEENAVLVAGWLLAVLAVGGVTWNRRAYLAEVERRAAEAERGREADGRRRATEERMRIARELHDVLAHNISLINVRAGAALFHLTEGRLDGPALRAELVEALTVIRDAGRDAGRELRATLGVLRNADDADPTAPSPGLASLPDLVATAGRAGLQVSTTVQNTPPRMPPEVDLAAFRIVQEALTNVARHARAKEAVVRIHAESDDLYIHVENTGAGAAAPGNGPGYGIRGMRERAAALGGDLRAGPCGDDGFRVTARLPLRERS